MFLIAYATCRQPFYLFLVRSWACRWIGYIISWIHLLSVGYVLFCVRTCMIRCMLRLWIWHVHIDDKGIRIPCYTLCVCVSFVLFTKFPLVALLSLITFRLFTHCLLWKTDRDDIVMKEKKNKNRNIVNVVYVLG